MTELQMTAILFKLADIGVTGIAISYDGGGDSGSIESMVYTTEPCETSQDVENVIDDIFHAQGLDGIDTALHSEIQDYAYDILNDIEDWWNNEGGFGYMYIQVPSGKYHINNNIRIIETESFGHEGSLMDKTKDN